MASVGRVPRARRAARAGQFVQTQTAARPRGPRARLSVGGVLCPPPPQLGRRSPAQALTVQSWDSGHNTERGTRWPQTPQTRHHHVLLDRAVSCHMSVPFSHRDTRGLLPGCPDLTSNRHVHRVLVQEPSARSEFTVFWGSLCSQAHRPFPKAVLQTPDTLRPLPP